jgi:hypothetical protein
MMLEYLVTSRTRRRLLLSLWRDGERGSASYLSRCSGTTFANAYSELKAMSRAGLARTTREGGKEIYEANRSHAAASALAALVAAAEEEGMLSLADLSKEKTDQDTRLWLRDLGAPLLVEGDASREPRSTEQAIAAGIELAHRDAAVARALPVCLWRWRDRLDEVRLEEEASLLREKHALGFFFALTAALCKDAGMKARAERFRDRRVRKPRDFFTASGSGYASKLAEGRTPNIARRWHYRMNMNMDAFKSLFLKHLSDEHLQG